MNISRSFLTARTTSRGATARRRLLYTLLALSFTASISACGGGGGPAEPIVYDVKPIVRYDVPEGFQVFGEDGRLQLDSNFMPVTFLQKRVVYPSEWGVNTVLDDGRLIYGFGIDVPANSIVCVLSPTYEVTPIRSSTHYGVYSFGPPSDVVFYIYTPGANATSNYGLQTFNASGNLTFSADMALMRIVAVAQSPALQAVANGGPPNVVINLPPSEGPYAACLTMPKMYGLYKLPGSDIALVSDGVRTPPDWSSIYMTSLVPIETRGGVLNGYEPNPGWNRAGLVLAVSVKGL